MADNDTKVTYRAVADFSRLAKALRDARKEVNALKASEKALNNSAGKGSKAVQESRKKSTKAIEEEIDAFEKEATTAKKVETAVVNAAEKRREHTSATRDGSRAVRDHSDALNGNSAFLNRVAFAMARATRAAVRFRDSNKMLGREGRNLLPVFRSMTGGAERVNNAFQKLGNYRPRLVPPFIALIPIIGGLLALLNPLVALLGAVGIAGFALASSLASVGGAALGAVPGIAALITSIFALKSAFKGIGSVFQQYNALQEEMGSGGGGGAAAVDDLAERLEDANFRYQQSILGVADAERSLSDARKNALRDLEDLRKAVERAQVNEDDAAANLELAREAYYNILADPGSTKGQKLAALVDLQRAEQNLADVRDDNIRNQEDLTQAEKDGVDGNRSVVAAERALTLALREQKKALEDLKDLQEGRGLGGGGGGGALNAFQKALDALSPSARSVVLALIAIREEWGKLRGAVQEAFFSEIVDSVGLLNKLLVPLQTLLAKAAGAIGRVIDRGLRMVTSGPWIRDFGIIAEQNVGIIEAFGDGILFLIDAFKDITVAAGPFLQALGDGFKEGAENFRDLVSAGRESGGLASWLETVRQRMGQWWQVIKNIGKTLFNYASAAGEFGQWLTDGLESLSEGWLANSEAALEDNSGFRQYLEDIKPVLSAVNDLLGTFFGWFRDKAVDPATLQRLEDIITKITDELGPALGGIFDSLDEAGIGEGFVDALTSIVESISTILENGGASAFQSFFDAVDGFFGMIADFVKTPGVKEVLEAVGPAIGTIAAATFIGKFTGINALIGKLITLFAISGLTGKLGSFGGFFKGLRGLGAVKGLGLLGFLIGSLAVLAEQGGRQLSAGGTIIENAPAIMEGDTEASREVRDVTQTANAQNIFDSLGGFLLDWFAPEWAASVDTWIAEMVSGANDWLDSILPPEGVKEFWDTLFTDFNETWEPVGEALSEFWTWLTTPIDWDQIWEDWGVGAEVISENWETFWADAATEWDNFWAEVTAEWNNFWGTVSANWNSFWGTVEANWNGFWNAVRTNWNGFWNAVRTNWNNFWLSVQVRWDEIVSSVRRGWDTVVANVRGGFDRAVSAIRSWFYNMIREVAGFFGIKIGEISTGGGGRPDQVRAKGGVINPIYRAQGGSTFSGVGKPRGTDTVPAMLTPGEYVLRKSIVEALGVRNLDRVNAGQGGLYFDGGGLIPNARMAPLGRTSSMGSNGYGSGGGDYGFNVENLIINNPEPEPASDSLPRSIRKVSYMRTGR